MAAWFGSNDRFCEETNKMNSPEIVIVSISVQRVYFKGTKFLRNGR